MTEDEQEHGPTAYYAGGYGDPYYQPVLECLCGFHTGRQTSWQDAGAVYDEHLHKTRRIQL